MQRITGGGQPWNGSIGRGNKDGDMGLFSALVGGAIETIKLPVAVVKDAATLCNFGDGSYTAKQLEKIKREAEKADD